jgi:hypothetical protein
VSEHITHTAVMDDGARLALHSSTICDAFKLAFGKRLDIARFSAMTRSGDNFTIKLLRELRAHWPGRREGDLSVEKLSFLLGWRCHLAADRTFKPVYRILQPEHYTNPDDDGSAPSDVTVYHDVVVFREVYGGGRFEPFTSSALDFRLESHPAAAALPVTCLERLMMPLWQEQLLAIQTAKGIERFQRAVLDVQRYARAYHSPDPELMRRYIIEPNFYNPADPVIVLVRSIQRGLPLPDISLEKALAAARNQSQYAQSLERAYRYLLAASDYFTGKITEKELEERCDVGKPHVPPELDPRRRRSE